MRRRLLITLGAVLAAVALVAGTWAAASHFQSPAQREASAQAPTPGPVLVTVTRGDLTERTTLNASATPATSQKVALPLPEGRAVLTRAGVEKGDTLASGQVAAWVNDRPVIALRGAFPLFRDLGPGDTGSDVALVQQALTDLGYGLAADGVLGPATLEALKDLYTEVGSQAPTRPVTEAPSTAGTQSTAQAAPTDPPAQAAAGGSGASRSQRTEVYLPLSEVLVLPATPVTVTDTPAVGTLLTVDSASLTTSDGGLTLTAGLTGPVSARVTTGMSATATVGTTSVPVTVTSTAPQTQETNPDAPQNETGTDAGGAGGGVRVVLTPKDGNLPRDWEGRNDILITLDLTEPLTDVLILPERALATDAGGTSNVLAVGDDGSLRQVAVTRLACVSGTCALAEPEAGTGVPEGTQVRVDR